MKNHKSHRTAASPTLFDVKYDTTFSDVYFPRSRDVIKKFERNARVRYRVFSRRGGLACGFDRAVEYIRRHTADSTLIYSKHDGEYFAPNESVMVLEGFARELVVLETTYLGMLSYSAATARMRAIVDAGAGAGVIDMSARHYPPELLPNLPYAAFVGGAIGTSTEVGVDFVNALIQAKQAVNRPFGLYGTIPHALNAVFQGDSILSAEKYGETFPEVPLTLLTDFEGREKDIIQAGVRKFGKQLFAIRLDTHGGRVHQGGTERSGAVPSAVKSLEPEDRARWGFGEGVTIEEVFNARKWLDEAGGRHVKIVVSSGFNEDKTRAFASVGAPMDFIGTGSWVSFDPMTSDIFEIEENGEWISRTKVGRSTEAFKHEIKGLHKA